MSAVGALSLSAALNRFRLGIKSSVLFQPAGLPLTWFLVVGGVVGLPLLLFVPDIAYRYNFQWLLFYLSCGGCSALVFFQVDLRRNFFRYLQTYFPSESVALLLVMIAGSIFVHGFYVQAVALLTMLMVLGTWPLLSFLWFEQSACPDHLKLLIRIVLGVVLAESLFLTVYQGFGLGMTSLKAMALWPRIFINIRDNNQWLACGFWVPISLWLSIHRPNLSPCFGFRSKPWIVVVCMAMFWYLDLLTYGRGAFLAMLAGVVCVVVLFSNGSDRNIVFKFLRDQLFAFGIALLSVVALRSADPFSQMGSRFARDMDGMQSERWKILIHWIDGWLNSSLFWGQGWGVIPEDVSWAPWSMDPHNIYVQILSDGGFWAVGFILFAVTCVLLSRKPGGLAVPWAVFASGLLVYQGVDRIWAISSGLYIILVTSSLHSSFEVGAQLIQRIRAFCASGVYLLSGVIPACYVMALIYGTGRP